MSLLPGHAPATNDPPEHDAEVDKHVPLPDDVEQLALTQHWMSLAPGQ